ncbi:hypothetical protein [Sphingosinicella rhizophila]|uniref:Uncharacterized protein n=1 Tax=Sphingosinicella rhizophila TaxID=3050082 RepID=A0ABU3Q4F6_9SPHN|nr:hypothetical protein [Sphingosinicella sp. GR2756]MDT9598299.1 hypothetical protein [Sphingosinicella sp. GR2756]
MQPAHRTPPQPQPDAAQLERLLARLETCSGSCPSETPSPAFVRGLPVNFDEKVRDADRLVPAIERLPTDKIDPSLAVALIG